MRNLSFYSKYIYRGAGRRISMYELTEMEMQSINGGSALIYLIYVILGVGAYKLLRSKRGRMSLPRLIQIEWG